MGLVELIQHRGCGVISHLCRTHFMDYSPGLRVHRHRNDIFQTAFFHHLSSGSLHILFHLRLILTELHADIQYRHVPAVFFAGIDVHLIVVIRQAFPIFMRLIFISMPRKKRSIFTSSSWLVIRKISNPGGY
jgi:hypothetical protein